MISMADPEWYSMVETFLINNPVFGKWAYMCPLTRPNSPHGKSFTDTLLWYIAGSGVNSSYQQTQSHMLLGELKKANYNMPLALENITKDGKKVQPKKLPIYNDIWQFCVHNDLKLQELNISHLPELAKIKGIGVSCVACMKQCYDSLNINNMNIDDTNSYVEITDRDFLCGLCTAYDIQFTSYSNVAKSISQSKVKEIVDTWGQCKIVGSILCTQISHYYCRKQ